MYFKRNILEFNFNFVDKITKYWYLETKLHNSVFIGIV